MLLMVTSSLLKSPMAFSSSLSSRRKLGCSTMGVTVGVSIQLTPNPISASTKAVDNAAQVLKEPKSENFRGVFRGVISVSAMAAYKRSRVTVVAMGRGMVEQVFLASHSTRSRGSIS